MTWTPLHPPLRTKEATALFRAHARSLSRIDVAAENSEEQVDHLRRELLEAARAVGPRDRQALTTAALVVTDLAVQRWPVRVRRGVVEVHPPEQVLGDPGAEKERVRKQELVKRDAQLGHPAVKKFVRSMERTRIHCGRFVSIFSLMRDGRELADALWATRAHMNNGWIDELARVVDPYLQFVTEEACCEFTGLRLMDVWRYFRHTWTNQYTSVPGRSMMFLVRDRAAEFHPIIGICALSSPIVQIRERDTWVGWHPSVFMERVRSSPTNDLARWLVDTVDRAIAEIYVEDFIEDGLLTRRSLLHPSEQIVERLLQESVEQRRQHHRYSRSNDLKSKMAEGDEEHWVRRARSHLFRSKRSLALAEYLRARLLIQKTFKPKPTADKLAKLAATTAGQNVIRKILKKAKGDRVGIAVADISVCGAVQPYNAILGGKLVSMLAASPEVVQAYRDRYSRAESEIASAMAGRAIIRPSNLVLLGTTSLYGVGSSQYNRIKIPCERAGGRPNELIKFDELGFSEAFGTSQYSEETVDALATLVEQSSAGQRVNSIFGEGVSPKLRKVRQGIDMLGFPSQLLLKHHRRRVVYAVNLVRNLREFLLGQSVKPDYLLSGREPAAATGAIGAWWRERWLKNRIASDEVLETVSQHTLVRPIRHGARVVVPPPSGQKLLFAEPF